MQIIVITLGSKTPMQLFKTHTSLNTLLNPAHRIVLLTHKNPDGDAVGSALGLMHLLHAASKASVSVVMKDAIPPILSWLPGASEVYSVAEHGNEQVEEILLQADALVFLDFNNLSRMGEELQQMVTRRLQTTPNLPTVLIDHHPYPAVDCSVCITDTSKSATAELLATLIGLPQVPISALTPQAATCLLTGIYTDTGLLNHAADRSELFRVIAGLIDHGAPVEEIIYRVFKSNKLGRHKLLGYILHQKIQYYPELHAAVFALTQKELDHYEVSEEDLDGLVNFPLEVEGIEISVYLRENTEDGVKISFRSQGDYAVNQIAHECFGGGGHRNAAGAEHNGSLEEAQELVLQGIRKLIATK